MDNEKTVRQPKQKRSIQMKEKILIDTERETGC